MRTETVKASPKKRVPVKAKKAAGKVKPALQGVKKAARKTVAKAVAKKRKAI